MCSRWNNQMPGAISPTFLFTVLLLVFYVKYIKMDGMFKSLELITK